MDQGPMFNSINFIYPDHSMKNARARSVALATPDRRPAIERQGACTFPGVENSPDRSVVPRLLP